MTGYAYRTTEDAIIREWYAKEGLPGAMIKLKQAGYQRTNNSVRRRASILKIKSPYCTANTSPSKPPAPYTWNPRWDQNYAQVQELLAQGARVAEACRIAGIERGKFYRMRKVKEGK